MILFVHVYFEYTIIRHNRIETPRSFQKGIENLGTDFIKGNLNGGKQPFRDQNGLRSTCMRACAERARSHLRPCFARTFDALWPVFEAKAHLLLPGLVTPHERIVVRSCNIIIIKAPLFILILCFQLLPQHLNRIRSLLVTASYTNNIK